MYSAGHSGQHGGCDRGKGALLRRGANVWRLRIYLAKVEAPEMGRGREEFQRDSLAFSGIIVSEVNDSTLLFFLREWIREDQHCANIEILPQVQQPAMRTYHDCVGRLTKASAVTVFPGGEHANAFKESCTAPLDLVQRLSHPYMLGHAAAPVNAANSGVSCGAQQGLARGAARGNEISACVPMTPAWACGLHADAPRISTPTLRRI
jgi:hypothetical protein